MSSVLRFSGLILVVVLAFGLWWLQQQPADETGMKGGHAMAASGALDSDASAGSLERAMDDPGVVGRQTSETYRDQIRQRVANASRKISLPAPPAMRSPSGDIDLLQCARSDADCDYFSPFFASSWDEAQWMRKHGFVDEEQLKEAANWSELNLDRRLRGGDQLAVAELARRFVAEGRELEARELLKDGVRNGNIHAAHRLAAMDEGRTLPHYSRPGLEWLFIARRMGDSQANMTYIMSRYPNLQPHELDHAMLIADRHVERLGLNARPVRRRPER